MKQTADNEELLIRYLLGDLGDEQQQEIEERYIDDREFYEQLLIVEDDLIDAYARGEMSEHQRAKFESHFLRSPERSKRVEFAEALETLVTRRSQADTDLPERPSNMYPRSLLNIASWPVALRVAAAAIVLGLGVWLVVETVGLRNRVQRAESEKAILEKERQELEQLTEQERKRNEELNAELDRMRSRPNDETPGPITPDPQRSTVVTFALTPGMVRGAGGARELIIPPGAQQVDLKVSFRRGDFKSYRAVIQTVEGREIWSRTGLKAKQSGSSKAVSLTIPASLFASDDYILVLGGVAGDGRIEPISEYSLPVRKK